MRVTQQTIFNNLTRYLNDNREALAKYQQQVSSGKRVTKASDDNIAFTTSRHLENSIRQNEQYQSNISSGLTKARFAGDALNSMIDVLIDFKSIAVNAATDSLSAEDREIMADQVEGLKKKLIGLGNTEFNDGYLFGGTKTGIPPFSIDVGSPGEVDYAGNNKALQTKISDISSLNISITGADLRNTGSGDLFGILQNMENALRANDTTAINAGIDSADGALNHVINLSAKLGNTINRMDFLNVQLKGNVIDMNGEVSRLVDANYAKAFSMVQKYKTTYAAALSVHAKIIQTSLLDFL